MVRCSPNSVFRPLVLRFGPLGLIGVGVVAAGFVAARQDPAHQPIRPDAETPNCTAGGCHIEQITHDVVHGPTAQNDCQACHEYVDPSSHLFSLTLPKKDLCLSCHEMEHAGIQHTPVKEGNCVGCHDPHGSDQPLMLVADPFRGLCITCHEQDFSDKEYVHGPVAVGACITCHEPHSSWEENLLIKPQSKLCADCHSEMEAIKKPGHMIHQPMEEGCSRCHDPHASNAKYQLHDAVPQLCYSCHDDMKDTFENSALVHGAAKEEGGCVTCHSPHQSDFPKLQKAGQPEICLTCHNKEIELPDGRILTNMASLLEENPDHHGPVRDGSCTSCHSPHASDHFSLLASEYPKDFYAPFDVERYAICFSCHQKELATEEHGRGLTKFRNGSQNLHYLHVNQEKGRTCRACHEVHASQRPSHIREAVPFGKSGWMLEIRFQATETGGSCAPGCHKEKTYER